MKCSVTLVRFCSEALQIVHKRATNTQGEINTTIKESSSRKMLCKAHLEQGHFEHKAKIKFSSIMFLFKWQPFAARGKRSVKTCYSFCRDTFVLETINTTTGKHGFLTNEQATSPAAQMQSKGEKENNQTRQTLSTTSQYILCGVLYQK